MKGLSNAAFWIAGTCTVGMTFGCVIGVIAMALAPTTATPAMSCERNEICMAVLLGVSAVGMNLPENALRL
jgi:hypothetical protein